MDTELERLDLAEFRGRIAYEHVHRYALCRESVAGKRVLDLACGTGYGSALLAQAGAEVTAIDISPEAIREAKARHGDHVKFLIADCHDLPFEDGKFDVVVANEMIEHVEDHDALIAQAKRVLAEDGLFLVSTPNKPVYNRYKAPNVFHVSEMDIEEFRRLLKRHFGEVHLTGTRMALVSVGYELDRDTTKGNTGAAELYRMSVEDGGRPNIEGGDLWLADAEYLLAACSQKPFVPATPRSSVLYSREDDLWLEHEKIMAWASRLDREDETLRAELQSSRQTVEARDEALEIARHEHANLEERVTDLRRVSESASDALLYQREGMQRELSLVSRLMGRVSGTETASDANAMVERLFDLGETLTQLRTQVAEVGPLRDRLAQAERDGAQQRALAEAAWGNVAQARDDLASAQTEAEAARAETLTARMEAQAGRADAQAAQAEAQAAQTDARDARAEAQAARADAQFAQAEAQAARADAQAAKAEAQAARTDARDAQAETQSARTNAQSARDELKKTRLVSIQAPRDREPGGTLSSENPTEPDSRQTRSRERFDATHRRVRASLQRAPQAIQGRLSGRQDAPAARTRGWTRRLLGQPADPFHTAIFDPTWIAAQAPDLQRTTLGAFLADPRARTIDPHPLFASARYVAAHHDVSVSGMAPLGHYVRHGWREGRNPHPLFANDWYLEQNPDVLASGRLNPLDHYLQFGWREGRWPNPVFDPRAYVDRYPDVEEAGVEPLTHFVAHGFAEGREAQFRAMDPEWQRFVPQAREKRTLIEYFLSVDPVPVPVLAPAPQPAQSSTSAVEAVWPPRPLGDFWPPQTLRDFVVDGYGEEAIDLYWYLYSVMNAYSDRQKDFAASAICTGLIDRARERAALRSVQASAVPDASIVVPVYNNILDTLLCIVSLLETNPEHSFEIIVADDGSTDATPQIICSIGGAVRYVRQPRNYGFLGNCNEAAKQARGRYIVLLNNDTIVMPHWLDELVMPFDTFANVGLTGSKLINWDGSLQEAGGIFWRDGSAWNFGRGQYARAPEFNYVKDVDYCSGAAIAISASIWRELGGFDPVYTPAYCEDSDIAFRLREAGYRTLYSPGSEVIHHEGRSHGRDVSSGVKAYQTTNQARLLERWLPVLERDHYPNGQNVLRARDRSFDRRHMLIVDHYVPQLDRDAGSRTMFGFVQTLVDDGWSVTFWPDNLWRDPEYTPKLQNLGVEVIFGSKYRNCFESFLREREGLYDVVMLSRPHIAKDYVAAVRALKSAKIIYYGHDIHFQRMAAQARLENGDENDPRIAEIKALELSICNASHIVLYPSEDEARTIRKLIAPGVRAEAIPAYRFDETLLQAARIRIDNRAAVSGPLRLLFVGGFRHQPNVDGIVWFCEAVAPLLRASAIPFVLKVVGSNPNETIMALAEPDIDIIGFVSDGTLDALYRDSDVVIAPLRYGAGVKGKVVEAMARGAPVVTTDVGAQGIDPEGAFLFVGNEAQAFMHNIVLAADLEAARSRTIQAVDFIEEYYSQGAMARMFRSILG